MCVTETQTKKRFGSLRAQANSEPVFIEQAGQLHSVIPPAEQHKALPAHHGKARRVARTRAFESEFADWLAEQNARFEAHGIPSADLRPW
jgi:hypothetical protein